MSELVIYPENIQELLQTNQQDSIWFQNDMNPIATLIYGDSEASVFCVGDVRVVIGESEYRNVNDIIPLGITNDDELFEAESRGDVTFLNNNWFEIFDHKTDETTGFICHSIEDALYSAEAYVTGVYS
jgi:hypothetical protein